MALVWSKHLSASFLKFAEDKDAFFFFLAHPGLRAAEPHNGNK